MTSDHVAFLWVVYLLQHVTVSSSPVFLNKVFIIWPSLKFTHVYNIFNSFATLTST